MNIEKLRQNIIDQVIEAQIKLGYAKETIRLYYPLESLAVLVDATDVTDIDDFISKLDSLFEYDELTVTFKKSQSRIEISVTPASVEYIYNNVERSEFLVELIGLFSNNHHLTLEDIEGLFKRYSKDYYCEAMQKGSEFDYVLHFNDKEIDSYYYCIKMEMGHTIYHRFTETDYKNIV